jgi:hypothetical protein
MVLQYEQQYQKLQSELNESYKLIKEEEKKRLLLEEEMRKMLLKNMTNINFETLHIFQQINQNNGGEASPLPPQLQSFAESLQAASMNTTTTMHGSGGGSGKEHGKTSNVSATTSAMRVRGNGTNGNNTLAMSIEEKLQTLSTQPTPPPPHPYSLSSAISVTSTLPPPSTNRLNTTAGIPPGTPTSLLSPSSSISSIQKGLTTSMISNASSYQGYTQGVEETNREEYPADQDDGKESESNSAVPTSSSGTGILDRSQDPYFLDRLSHLYQQSMSTTNKLAHHEGLTGISSNYPPGAAGGIPVPNTSISYQLNTPTNQHLHPHSSGGSGMQQRTNYSGHMQTNTFSRLSTPTSASKRMSTGVGSASSGTPNTATNSGRSTTPGSTRTAGRSVTSSQNVVGITIASTAGYPTPNSRSNVSTSGNHTNTPPPRPMRF